MVAGAIAGNISAEATTPASNTFADAMRGPDFLDLLIRELLILLHPALGRTFRQAFYVPRMRSFLVLNFNLVVLSQKELSPRYELDTQSFLAKGICLLGGLLV